MLKILIKYGHIKPATARVDVVGPAVGVLIVQPVGQLLGLGFSREISQRVALSCTAWARA